MSELAAAAAIARQACALSGRAVGITEHVSDQLVKVADTLTRARHAADRGELVPEVELAASEITPHLADLVGTLQLLVDGLEQLVEPMRLLGDALGVRPGPQA